MECTVNEALMRAADKDHSTDIEVELPQLLVPVALLVWVATEPAPPCHTQRATAGILPRHLIDEMD